jgi:hypothetical protein
MMKIPLKRLALSLTLAMPFALGSQGMAQTTILSVQLVDTTSYQDCLARYAPQFAGSQVNDACFIHHDQFMAIPEPRGTGKTVWIDESHYNFHKRLGRYLPFTRLLEEDGFTVNSFPAGCQFTESLSRDGIDSGWQPPVRTVNGIVDGDGPAVTLTCPVIERDHVLVISNPLNVADDAASGDWAGPISSAFTEAEIHEIRRWILNGGSALLIADHYPFPGAMDALGETFGLKQYNGYHFDPKYNDVFLYDMLWSTLPGNQTELAKDIMSQRKVLTDISPLGGTIVRKGNTFEEPRTVRDDLVTVVRGVMIGLGAEVNSLIFWAGAHADWEKPRSGPDDFQYSQGDPVTGYNKSDGWLSDHPIIRGATATEGVPFIVNFTGQHFQYQGDAYVDGFNGTPVAITQTPLMIAGEDTFSYLTNSADGYFGNDRDESENALVSAALSSQRAPNATVPKVPSEPGRVVGGLPQGRVSLSGWAAEVNLDDQPGTTGRIVFSAEAGMFTAQIAANGSAQMGFNNPLAIHNQQFVLNTVRWLAGVLDEGNQQSAPVIPAVATGRLGLSAPIPAYANNPAMVEAYAVAHGLVQNVIYKAEASKIIQDARRLREDITIPVVTPAFPAEYLPLSAAGTPYAVEYQRTYGDGPGSGCSISQGTNRFDPTLPLLILVAGLYLFSRSRRTAPTGSA